MTDRSSSQGEVSDAPGLAPALGPADSPAVDHDQKRFYDLVFRVSVGVMLVVAIPLLMRQGRGQWFVFDEWDFLAQRSLKDPGSLFRPHNEHLVALPVVAYRVMWQIFGLRTYVPYQLMAVVSHTSVVLALVALCRRTRVSRVLTIAVAAFLLFFGPGAQNIVWGFQIGLTGALALGFLHVMLADHSGPWSRRDTLGLASGVGAVLCTGGLGALMVGAAATVAFIRRGWRSGTAHLAPWVLFAAWMLVAGTRRDDGPSVGAMFEYVADLLWVTASSMVQDHLLVGIGLLLLTGAGLTLASIESRHDIRGGRTVVPIVLAVTGVGVATVISIGRADAGGYFDADGRERYIYLIVALLLPSIALALDELSRRWRPVAVIAVAAVALALPANYRALSIEGTERLLSGSPNRVYAIGESSLLDDAPAGLEPDPMLNPEMTAGFLRYAKSSGRWFDSDSPSVAEGEWADFLLTVHSLAETPDSWASYACTSPTDAEPVLAAERGEVLSIHAADELAKLTIIKVDPPGLWVEKGYFIRPPEHRLYLEFLAPAQFTVQQLDQMKSVSLCSPP